MAFPNNPTSPPVLELNSHAINTSCVGFWPLTHVQGSTATDISTSGNNGTIAGTATWESGSLGQNLQFDGTSHFIDTGATPAATSLPLTVSAWIKPSVSANRCMIASSWLSSGTDRAFTCELNASNALSCYITSDGTFSTNSSITTTGTLTDGVWYHVVFVIESGGAIYVDGVSQALSGSLGSSMHTPNQNLLIGAGEPGAETFLWTGDMQNVRLFNTALSASDVALLYNRPWVGTDYDELWPYTPPVPSSMSLSTDTAATSLNSGCVAWWPLTEGSGNAANDIVSGFNGTQNSTEDWYANELGTVHRFAGSGTNNFFDNCGTTTDFSFVHETGTATISCWIRPTATGRSFILSNNDTGGARGFYSERGSGDGMHFFMGTGGAGSTDVSTAGGTAPSDGSWQHWVFVLDTGSSTAQFYKDGVAVTTTGTVGGTASGAARYVMALGSLTTSQANTFDGDMQNVRIWNRALTADEITLLYERPWEGEATYGDALYNDPPPTLALGTTAEDVAINNSQEIWLPLTDGIGTTAVDISGNGNNGTLTGTSGNLPLWHVGKLGYSVAGDGTNARRVEISNTALSAVPAMSTSCWIFNDAVNNYEVYYGYGQLNYLFAFQRVATQDVLRFFTNGLTGNTDLRTPAGTLKTGVWQHVVGTYDGSTKRLYFDGVEVASASATGSITQPTSNTAILSASGSGYDVDGKVQNVRLWSRALSAVEVQSLYETPWIGSNYTSIAAIYNYIFRSKRFRRL